MATSHYFARDLADEIGCSPRDITDAAEPFVDRWYVDSCRTFQDYSSLINHLRAADVNFGEVSFDVRPRHREAFLHAITDEGVLYYEAS